MQDNWLNQAIDEDLTLLAQEQKPEGWFSLSAVSNVPFISFPGLTQKECYEVQEQIKNVLRISRNENEYKPVAITYSLNEYNLSKRYKKVLGDASIVRIMYDEPTKALLKEEDQKGNLVVISIHNHPNNSSFSLNDLYVFSKNSSIKLMCIVNREGEVSFLMRSNQVDLSKIVTQNIVDFVPDFAEKKKEYEKENGSATVKIADIIEPDKRKEIIRESIMQFQNCGVFFSKYIGKQNEADIAFIQNNVVLKQSFTDSHSISLSQFDESFQEEEDSYEY